MNSVWTGSCWIILNECVLCLCSMTNIIGAVESPMEDKQRRGSRAYQVQTSVQGFIPLISDNVFISDTFLSIILIIYKSPSCSRSSLKPTKTQIPTRTTSCTGGSASPPSWWSPRRWVSWRAGSCAGLHGAAWAETRRRRRTAVASRQRGTGSSRRTPGWRRGEERSHVTIMRTCPQSVDLLNCDI